MTTEDSSISLINRLLLTELLLQIFSYLDIVTLCRCACVSKYWNQLALDGSNWKKVDFFAFQTTIKGDVLTNLSSRCGGFLKSLSLRGCQNVTDSALRQFAQNCFNLVELQLNGCKYITDVIQHETTLVQWWLDNGYRNPSKLYVSQSWSSLPASYTTQFEFLFSHHKSVPCGTQDIISWKDVVGDGLVAALILAMINILCECDAAIYISCHDLEFIDISWCIRISDDGVKSLVQKCTKLSQFSCKGCSELTDFGFKQLGRSCKELKTLNAHSCHKLTDLSVSSISNGCHQLTHLCLSGCSRISDESLSSLSQGCPDLTTLEVAGCVQLTDAGFGTLFQSCSKIEKLDLEDCVWLTDLTLDNLSCNCRRLSNLTLSNCERITDEGIRLLCHGPCVTEGSLRVLELDNCPLISDSTLTHLWMCHSLRRLAVYDCHLVTRSGILRLQIVQPKVVVHAYFASYESPVVAITTRRRLCLCCTIS